MITASGTITAPFTCVDSSGVPTTPTGTPTYTLVKNGVDTATTGNCSGSSAQWYASATVPSNAAVGDMFWFKVSAVISGTTYTVNTVPETVVVQQTGDSFARIGSAGAGLTAIGDTRLANLDATVSSRLDSASYSAPPSVASIRSEMDSNSTKLANLDATISSRLATSGYTAPPSVSAIRSEMDTNSTRLANLDSPISSLTNLASLSNLRGPAVMEIPASSTMVYKFILTVNDIEGKAVNLDSAPTITATNAAGTSRSSKLSAVTTAATGRYTFTYTVSSTDSSEGLIIEASGTISAESRYACWVGAVVDYDSVSMLASISSTVSSLPSAAATASAVRTELTTELGRIDTTISSRLASAGYTSPPSVASIRSEMDSNSTKLANLDATVSSRLASASYTTPLSAAGVRTAVGLAAANLDTQLSSLSDNVLVSRLAADQLLGADGDVPAVIRESLGLAAANLDTQLDGIDSIKSTTDQITFTDGRVDADMGTDGVDAIVSGIAESLTAPGFAASVSIQEGTYATVADVEARLTAYGVTLAADVDEYDGTRGSTELQMIEVAIEYANSLIDEYIIDLVHPTSHRATATFTRPSGVAWLRDRCVDIACYRLATLGGRTASDVLANDYASAIDRLTKAREQIIRIPHLIYTSPTRPYATEYGGGPVVIHRRGT